MEYYLKRKPYHHVLYHQVHIFISMEHKVYQLIDPRTNEIRYVGRTNQKLSNRLKRHLTAKDKSHRVNWITNLRNEGLEPIIELICETPSFEKVCELEYYYITKYKDEGFNLVNMTDGGDGSIGFTHDNETKIKLSQQTTKRMENPEVKEHLSNVMSEIWENRSDEDKLKNQLNQKGRRNIHQLTIEGEFIKEWVSLREIERELGYFRANISPCLKGEFKQAYGFDWVYSE